MVQNQAVQNVKPIACPQKTRKPMKSVKISKGTVETMTPQSSPHSVRETGVSPGREETEAAKSNEEVEEHKEERVVTSLIEEIKRKRKEERLAKEKEAEEARERFVKEAAERKAAEREEIIKQAKRFILYRKPMCRRINQGLLVSECIRELDAQIKFRETIRNADKDEEMAYVNSLKEDVAKYEEEMKRKTEQLLEKRKQYANELKKQMEENEHVAKAKEKEEFEAGQQDQINMSKYLQDVKEHEAQLLQDKKQKLKQFFKDAIEEKKQFDLEFKREEEFEERAHEIYRNSKLRIQKMHKAVRLKEKEEIERRAQLITDKYKTFLVSKENIEAEILKKAQEEQEEQYQEKQRTRKERENQMRKELRAIQTNMLTAMSKRLQEEKDLKTWETMQRFKKAECDVQREAEERKQKWNRKMDYANTLRKYINDKETERKQEKLAEEEAMDMTKVIEKENQKVLDYAEEVLNESKGVRPLFPILKAVQECKRQMGLIPPKKREEIIDAEPKRRRRIRKCTKFVPEDKICYL